jgi:glycine dehydrogenase subunit 2
MVSWKRRSAITGHGGGNAAAGCRRRGRADRVAVDAGVPRARGESAAGVIIPDSAHGTNPASVTLGGYETVTVPSERTRLCRPRCSAAVLDTDVAGSC